MITVKPTISKESIEKLLKDQVNSDISDIEIVTNGEKSLGFFFTSNSQQFIIRINDEKEPFEKDSFAFKYFSSQDIPMPKIIKIGSFEDKYYAVSERVPGKSISEWPEGIFEKILPEFLDILSKIHARKVEGNGFGSFDGKGKTFFDSWQTFILSINDEKWFEWNRVFKETFFEKEVFDKAYIRLKEVIKYCPEERYFVHGDFAFRNVMTDGKRITGILDWGEAKFGDYLFDIAWLDFWREELGFANLYESKREPIPHYKERILSYQIWSALASMHFYAKTKQEEKYDWPKNRLLALIK